MWRRKCFDSPRMWDLHGHSDRVRRIKLHLPLVWGARFPHQCPTEVLHRPRTDPGVSWAKKMHSRLILLLFTLKRIGLIEKYSKKRDFVCFSNWAGGHRSVRRASCPRVSSERFPHGRWGRSRRQKHRAARWRGNPHGSGHQRGTVRYEAYLMCLFI